MPIGVKFTLIAFVLPLLFVETSVIADDRPFVEIPVIAGDRSNNAIVGLSAPNQRSTPFSGDGRFLNSLRFWERNNPQPQPLSHGVDTSLVRTRQETGNVHVARRDTQASHSPPATTRAPAPPSIPFFEQFFEKDNPPPSSASPPAQAVTIHEATIHDSVAKDTPIPQEVLANLAQPKPAFHSSYSFDRRDWIENLHQQAHIVSERTAIQTTAFRAPGMDATVFSPPPVPSQPGLSRMLANSQNERWDGQATTLIAPAIIPAAPTVPANTAPLDLTPSFLSRLPHTQTSGVVVVQANFPLTEIASILGEIEQLQHDLTHYIGVPAPREKIELCLFRDEASYIAFLREFFPRAPRDRRALYVKLDGKPGVLLVQKTRDFEVDIRHEMTHAILHASIPKVPIWLDEGLAKYFELPAHERATGHPYLSSVRWNARLGMVPSLERLGRMVDINDMGAREYRDSWAWVHFLIHRSPETHQLLAAYLQMLATWEPPCHGDTVSSSSYDNRLPWTQRVFARPETMLPSLHFYLGEIVLNQREAFREHFGAMEQ